MVGEGRGNKAHIPLTSNPCNPRGRKVRAVNSVLKAFDLFQSIFLVFGLSIQFTAFRGFLAIDGVNVRTINIMGFVGRNCHK